MRQVKWIVTRANATAFAGHAIVPGSTAWLPDDLADAAVAKKFATLAAPIEKESAVYTDDAVAEVVGDEEE